MRLAILISGRGSNMICLADAISQHGISADITLVAANRPCPGLDEAASRHLPTALVNRADYDSRDAHEDALATSIEDSGAEWVFLAGYMAILSPDFVNRFAGRIINIHPSLLPDFKGLDTHQRALDHGVTRHGATVHVVTAELDDGPILLQAGLAVDSHETAAQLAARVLSLEHALFPFVLNALASGDLKIENGVPNWTNGDAALAAAPRSFRDRLTPAVIWPEDAKNTN